MGLVFLGISAGISAIFGSKKKTPQAFPYPVFDLQSARNQFSFPMNHPIDGTVYACCDAEPQLYVPLAGFHQYMYESKLSAFHSLCANLGVRRCSVAYFEDESIAKVTRMGGSGIPTSAGKASASVSVDTHQSSAAATEVFAEYPAPRQPLSETRTGWLRGEPTWVTMQSLRLGRDLERWKAEFTYCDEMNINAEVAAKVAGIGLEIGGKFEELRRRRWVFDVEFWPRP